MAEDGLRKWDCHCVGVELVMEAAKRGVSWAGAGCRYLRHVFRFGGEQLNDVFD